MNYQHFVAQQLQDQGTQVLMLYQRVVHKISQKINHHQIGFSAQKSLDNVTQHDHKHAIANLTKIFDKMFIKFENMEHLIQQKGTENKLVAE